MIMFDQFLNYTEYVKTPLDKRINYLVDKKVYEKKPNMHDFEDNDKISHTFQYKICTKNYIFQVKGDIIKTYSSFAIALFKTFASNNLKSFEAKFHLLENKDDKIKFLRQTIKKKIKIITKNDSFTFITNNLYKDYENWGKYFIFNQDLSNELFLNLCGIYKIERPKIIITWSKTFAAKKVIDRCNQELDKITKIQETPEKYTETKLTSNQTLILLDKIRYISEDLWDNLDTTKKANLISKITGFGSENIRKNIPNLDKSKEKQSKQFNKDLEYIEGLVKQICGN
jgi:hypothetical protein